MVTTVARLTKEDMALHLGTTPKQAALGLRRFSRDARVFHSNHRRFIHDHPNEWVGISGGKVRATAKSLDSLMSQLKRKGFPPNESFISYVDASGQKLIL